MAVMAWHLDVAYLRQIERVSLLGNLVICSNLIKSNLKRAIEMGDTRSAGPANGLVE